MIKRILTILVAITGFTAFAESDVILDTVYYSGTYKRREYAAEASSFEEIESYVKELGYELSNSYPNDREALSADEKKEEKWLFYIQYNLNTPNFFSKGCVEHTHRNIISGNWVKDFYGLRDKYDTPVSKPKNK